MKYLLVSALLISGCAGEGSNNLQSSSESVELLPVLPTGRIHACGEYSYAYANSGLLVIYGSRGIYELDQPGHLDLRGTRCSLDFDGQYLFAHHDDGTECTFRVV